MSLFAYSLLFIMDYRVYLWKIFFILLNIKHDDDTNIYEKHDDSDI